MHVCQTLREYPVGEHGWNPHRYYLARRSRSMLVACKHTEACRLMASARLPAYIKCCRVDGEKRAYADAVRIYFL